MNIASLSLSTSFNNIKDKFCQTFSSPRNRIYAIAILVIACLTSCFLISYRLRKNTRVKQISKKNHINRKNHTENKPKIKKIKRKKIKKLKTKTNRICSFNNHFPEVLTVLICKNLEVRNFINLTNCNKSFHRLLQDTSTINQYLIPIIKNIRSNTRERIWAAKISGDLIRGALDLSRGSTFDYTYSIDDLRAIAKECPNLQELVLRENEKIIEFNPVPSETQAPLFPSNLQKLVLKNFSYPQGKEFIWKIQPFIPSTVKHYRFEGLAFFSPTEGDLPPRFEILPTASCETVEVIRYCDFHSKISLSSSIRTFKIEHVSDFSQSSLGLRAETKLDSLAVSNGFLYIRNEDNHSEPYIKSLFLKHVSILPEHFIKLLSTNLTHLELVDMNFTNDYIDMFKDEGAITPPNLISLEIRNCPNITTRIIEILPPTIKTIVIENCPGIDQQQIDNFLEDNK